MMGWEFRDPWFLLLVLVAPLLAWLSARRPSRVQFSSLTWVADSPRSLRARLAVLPTVLWTLASVLLAVAIAGPRTPDEQTKISRKGIAIAMVLDRSSSMNARDLVQGDTSVDRLTVVKEVFRRFVLGGEGAGRGRPNDMIGLVAFARYADSLCPLTLDHGNLVGMLDDIQIVTERREDGTAIGDALALAVERLRHSPARSKIAILLTDGVNNSGQLEPMQAAELAAEHNVKVYCIGAGTQGVAPVPTIDPFTGRQVLTRAFVEIDEPSLKKIASRTGGRYYRATDEEALAEVYREIDRLERTKIIEMRYLQYHEHYAGFVMAGFVLLALAAVADRSLLRRLP